MSLPLLPVTTENTVELHSTAVPVGTHALSHSYSGQ